MCSEGASRHSAALVPASHRKSGDGAPAAAEILF